MVYQASFQDILFVLAGLAWIGYSAYRKSKKRGETSQSGGKNVSSKKKSVFEELMTQYTNEEAERQEATNPINEAYAVTPEVQLEETLNDDHVFSYDDYYEEGVGSEPTSDGILPSNEVERQIKVDVDTPKKQKISSKSFNLRKAFIYSEILKQKYI